MVTAESLVKTEGNLPAYQADAGLGMEGIGTEDLLVPFIRILDIKAPQVDRSLPEYIAGAEPGMLLNTGLGEVYPAEGVWGVPIGKEHNFVEWTPIDSGGGFVGIKSPDDPLVAKLTAEQGKFGKLKLDNGNELVDTYYLYWLLRTPAGDHVKAMTAYSSTNIKPYRQLATRITAIVGEPARFPIFAYAWDLSTRLRTKEKLRWYVWGFELHGGKRETALLPADSEMYQRARAFYLSIREGKVKTDFSRTDAANTEADEDLPF